MIARAVLVLVMVVMVMLMYAAKYVCRGDQRPGVEGDLGKWDNGNENAHCNSQGLGIALALQNVGRNGITDAITEHENANYAKTHIQGVLLVQDPDTNVSKRTP